jgi:hypothetical protein
MPVETAWVVAKHFIMIIGMEWTPATATPWTIPLRDLTRDDSHQFVGSHDLKASVSVVRRLVASGARRWNKRGATVVRLRWNLDLPNHALNWTGP